MFKKYQFNKNLRIEHLRADGLLLGSQNTNYKKNDGFTLIELMIVIGIIGILAAIAIPSYQDYVIRAKIPDATSGLSTKRSQMEQYFQDNHKYAIGAPPCVLDATTSRYFNFSCVAASTSDTTYKIQAVGKDSMAGFSYFVNETNVHSSAIVPPAKASFESASGACWITKPGGAC